MCYGARWIEEKSAFSVPTMRELAERFPDLLYYKLGEIYVANLIKDGYNLSEAEAEFGSDWLSK